MSRTDELKATFFQESEDLLEQLTDGLSALDSGDADFETINAVFRAVHSIKGGASAFGLDEVVRFAHRYENVLDALRSDELNHDAGVQDILTRAADHLNDVIEAARDGTEPETATSDKLIEELQTLTGGPQEELAVLPEFTPMVIDLVDLDESGPTEAVYTVRFVPHTGLFASGNEAGYLLRDLCALGEATVLCDTTRLPEFTEAEPDCAYLAWEVRLRTDAPKQKILDVFEFVDGLCELSVEPAETALSDNPAPAPQNSAEAPKAQPTEKSASPTSNPGAKGATGPKDVPSPKAGAAPKSAAEPVASTIRVELHRIDRMINLVGELVINQAMISQCLKKAKIAAGGDIDVGLEELRTLTRQIQDSVMAIRAQPVKSLFQRMSRIAREAGRDVDKTLHVETVGAGTEIDKTVIEKLTDPLTHMIRNAVDHGLEDADSRGAAGKDPIGTIRLSAAHIAGRVLIEISDDGAGIDRERVRAIAEQKGLVEPDAQLTAAEIDNLIFLPGFSTATELSSLSGRGVGMDVVRSSIQSLGGRVSISSRPGEGSTFTIELPLTLAVLDGMVIEVADQTVVIPVSSIIETMRLSAEETFKLGTDSAVVRIRGNYIPIIDVGAVMGYRQPVDSTGDRVILLVVTAEGTRAALLIDAIHDQRQVVIKGLSENYGTAHGVAAATILGDGRIALILDASAIVGGASGPSPAAQYMTAAE